MSRGTESDHLRARIALSHMFEPGNDVMRLLVGDYGPVEALERLLRGAGPVERALMLGHQRAPYDEARVQQDVDALGGDWTVVMPEMGGGLWPRALSDMPTPPLMLWVRGHIHLHELTRAGGATAIVGSRSATAYGMQVAQDIAAGLVGEGQTIVSGGAYGIDSAAHRGALVDRGVTISVQAGGTDRPYPTAHTQLFGQIAKHGSVITEQPPGVTPVGHRFLRRNEVIAALSARMVVVEATMRSGSLNAARHARNLGRPVGAVPGPVTSAQSVGCHSLIRANQAGLVTNAEEVMEL